MAEVTTSPLCPNCGTPVVVPKSTRSFICKACGAILKAVQTESEAVLKVLGRSVADDPEYQALERSVAETREELAEKHERYLGEAQRPVGRGALKVMVAGVLMLLAGVVLLVAGVGAVGGAILVAGVLLLIGSSAVRSSQLGRKRRVVAELSAELESLARERDMLEARASRMKVQS